MAGRGALGFGRGALRHEGGGGGVGEGGGARCWALLPPGLGWLGLNVIEDVLGGSGLRCRRGSGLELGLGFVCGLWSRRADGSWWLLGGCLWLQPGCGRGPRWGVGLGSGGVAPGGDGFGGLFERFSRRLGGGVLDDDMVVVVDEVVVVVDVVESEAGERAVGTAEGPGLRDGRRMLGPATSEKEGAESGTGRVNVLSLVTCACWCWCRCMWWCGGVVSAVRAPRLPRGCPYLLQDVWVRLLDVVEGAEEAWLNAKHVRLREVGVVLGGRVWARPQQRHEAGCHHVRAELWGGGAWGGGSPAVWGGLPLLGAERDLPQPPVSGDPPGPLGPLGKAIHRPTKALLAAVDGEQRVQGLAFRRARGVGSVQLILPGVCVEAWVVWGGGVVSREEEVGALHHPVASWCVVVGGGEDVEQIVHGGHIRGGGWLLVVGDGDIPRDVVPEIAQDRHPGDPCFPFPLFGVAGGGAGWGGAMLGSW